MFESKNKINKTFKITFIVMFSISLIFFIIASFRTIDYDINRALEFLMDIQFFKFWAVLWCTIGNILPPIVGFLTLAIILETYLMKLQDNQYNMDKKIHQFFKKNWINTIVIFYLIYLGIRIFTYYQAFSTASANHDFGWGPGNDVKAQGSYIYRFWSTIISVVFEIILIATFTFFTRTIFYRKKTFANSNTWFIAAKIGIFLFISYFMIWLVKHISGRPYFFSVIYEEMVERMEEMGWTESPDSYWGEGRYLPWYVPNNFIYNLRYWHSFSPNHSVLEDQYWNLDFPSGHTTGTTIFTSLIAFFNINSIKKINYRWFWICYFIGIFLIVNMAFTMVYYRFHWVTDVLWSIFVGVLLWVAAEKIVEKIVAKKILEWNKNNIKQNLGELITCKKNKKVILFWTYYDRVLKTKFVIKKGNTIESVQEQFKINVVDREYLIENYGQSFKVPK